LIAAAVIAALPANRGQEIRRSGDQEIRRSGDQEIRRERSEAYGLSRRAIDSAARPA